MIKNIFIPESFGGYYLFAKRILSFDVTRTHVHAVQVQLAGKTMRIEKFLEEKIEYGPTVTLTERTVDAIKKLVQHADPYDAVCTSLHSSSVVFKELTVPFVEYEKIKLILGFELEPLLPFPIAQSVFDFIITKQNLEEKKSTILVAAVLKENMAQYLSVSAQAGIEPDRVTVDLFALYGLYRSIPEYIHDAGNVALVDCGVHATRIAFITDGQLKFIRTLPKGLINVAKNVSDELKIQPAEAMEKVMRFGLESDEDASYSGVITRILTAYWSEIDFTIKSFEAQIESGVTKMLLLGKGSEIHDVCKFVSTMTNKPCLLFSVMTLLQDSKLVVNNGTHIPRSHIICLGAVFPSHIMQRFNLLRGDLTPSDKGLFRRQTFVAVALLSLIGLSLIGVSWWRLHSLKLELRSSNAQAVSSLKQRFKGLSGSILKGVATDTANQLEKEEQVVSFMDPVKPTMLGYLLELTNKIDKQSTGLVLEGVSIEGNTMRIRGKVKDFQALKVLEKNLHDSKMFEFKPLDTLELDFEVHLRTEEL